MAPVPGKENQPAAPPVTPPEQTKPPEAGKDSADKKPVVEASVKGGQIVERQQFMSDSNLDQLKKIHERKKKIDEEQKQYHDNVAGKTSQESWVSLPPKNAGMTHTQDVDTGIRQEVEEKFSEDEKLKSMMKKFGLDDATNAQILKQISVSILQDYFDKKIDIPTAAYFGGDDAKAQVKEQLRNYGKKDLLETKVGGLFASLDDIYEKNKALFKSPAEMMEKFSDFTETKFYKQPALVPDKFKTFLLIEQSNYDLFVTNFGKSIGLDTEKRKLDGDETNLMGTALSPEDMLKQKKLILTTTRVTIPTKPEDLDATLKTEIPKALPPITDAGIKQKIVDYLVGEIKKQNPPPDTTFELSPDGKWTKIDTAAEQTSKDDAKKAATDQLAQVAPETAAASTNIVGDAVSAIKGFDWAGALKSIMDFITGLFKSIASSFGGGGGGGEVATAITPELVQKLNEWKDITDEEKQGIQAFVNAVKPFASKGDTMDILIKNPDEMRKVLAKKKADTKPGETWENWMKRYLSNAEQKEINGDQKPTPQRLGVIFTTENTKDDQPAETITPLSSPDKKPGQPEKPTGMQDNFDEIKTVESLNTLKKSPDWKKQLAPTIGMNFLLFDHLRKLTDNTANKLDPEIRDHLKKFLQAEAEMEGQMETKVAGLFQQTEKTAQGSELYKKELGFMKKEPNWQASIEQKLKTSKEFRTRTYFIFNGVKDLSATVLDPDAKEVLAFLRTAITPTLQTQMSSEVEQFLGFRATYERFAKEFPGFEETLGYAVPADIMDQVRKRPVEQKPAATVNSTVPSGAKG